MIRLGLHPEVTAVPDGWQVQVLPAAGSDTSAVGILLRSPDGCQLLHTSVESPVSAHALVTSIAGDHDTRFGEPGRTAVLLAQGEASVDEVAAEIARLRRIPGLPSRALFVVVALGHQNPPGPELAPLARCWAVTIGSDGDELTVDCADQTPGAASADASAGRTLVIGGTRSGKSRWAERQVGADPVVCYVATAAGRDDPDWAQRVALHQQRRPAHWRTLETLDLVQTLAANTVGQSLLIDDLGNWVTRILDTTGGWTDDRAAYRRAAGLLVDAWRSFAGRAVLVTNDVGAGVHPATHAGRIFADEVGTLNSALAAESDEVVVVSAGLGRWLRTPDGRIEP